MNRRGFAKQALLSLGTAAALHPLPSAGSPALLAHERTAPNVHMPRAEDRKSAREDCQPSGEARPAGAVPGQIENFWRKTLAASAREPLRSTVEKVNARLPYLKYRVTFRSLGGVKVQGWLSKPVQSGANRKPLPAIVTAPGYGGWQQGITLSECQRGYVVLQVYPRSQGESEKFWKIDGPDKLTWHISQPQGYYYQGAYVDVIRGIEYLISRPDVDTANIGIMGTSQGGALPWPSRHWMAEFEWEYATFRFSAIYGLRPRSQTL